MIDVCDALLNSGLRFPKGSHTMNHRRMWSGVRMWNAVLEFAKEYLVIAPVIVAGALCGFAISRAKSMEFKVEFRDEKRKK